jgi:hypothetical protein
MNTAWMDAQFVLEFYQACLTLLRVKKVRSLELIVRFL